MALAYELYERGIIDNKDTDGLELVYGNHQAMVELVRKIGSEKVSAISSQKAWSGRAA